MKVSDLRTNQMLEFFRGPTWLQAGSLLRSAIAAGLLLCGRAFGAGTQAPPPAEPQRFAVFDSGTVEVCGMEIQYQTEGTRLRINQPPNVLARIVFLDWHTTYTNPETGKSVTLSASRTETYLS